MRLTAEDKQTLIEKIRGGAARAFRAKGYEAVSLDALMKESGLTRGAFYAHFKSKSALFAEVIRHEHPLLRMLEDRMDTDAWALHDSMRRIFAGYLDPENLNDVFMGCTFASLVGDVTRAGPAVQTSFDAALHRTCAAMALKQGHDAAQYLPALVLATGAVRCAYASADQVLQSDILNQAHGAFLTVLPDPRERSS